MCIGILKLARRASPPAALSAFARDGSARRASLNREEAMP